MSTRLLVTGATGFVGTHFRQIADDVLPNATLEGWGTSQRGESGQCLSVDLRDPEAVAKAVERFAPTHVLHLAALSSVTDSYANPFDTWSTNVTGTVNLCRALSRLSSHPNVIVVSSSNVYGESFNQGPVTEQSPTNPLNPYAASKLAAELFVGQLAARGAPFIIVRPFNHFGTGQSERFVIPALAKRIIEATERHQSDIAVGNLNVKRDFLPVRNVALAYTLLVSHFEHFVGQTINLCSGNSHQLSTVAEQLTQLAGASLNFVQDKALMRSADIPSMQAPAPQALIELGWTPYFDWQTELNAVLTQVWPS